MKKLAILVLVAVVGMVAFNLWSTGEFAVIPSFSKSEQESKVAGLKADFDAAQQQFAQAHRTASVGGIDTSSDVDAAIGSVKQVKRALKSLQKSLSEDKAKRRAGELAAAVQAFEQSL